MANINNKFLLSFVFVAMSAGIQAADLPQELRSILSKGYDDSRCQDQDFDCCGSTNLSALKQLKTNSAHLLLSCQKKTRL